MDRGFSVFVRLFVALVILVGFSAAASGREFYEGKTVRILVGYTPGGGPDIRGRIIGRFLGKYLPGNPRVIVQNMPGAGSLVATNSLFNVFKPDGLTLANLSRDVANMQLGERIGVKFDLSKFQWIGSMMRQGNIVFVRSSTPYGNVEELKKAKQPLIFAARSVGATNYVAAKGLEALGVPVKMVIGYGSAKLNLAFESGEVEASALGWTSLITGRPDWVKPGGLARMIVEFASAPTPGTGAVFGPDLKPVKGKEEIYELINKTLSLPQGNLAAPPGTPAQRMEELRSGYRKVLQDKEFQALAGKLNIPLTPVIGEDLARVFADFLAVSPQARAQFKEMLQ